MAISLDDGSAGKASLDEFRIHDFHERVGLLRQVVRSRTALTLTVPAGPHFCCNLFEVDPQRGELRFDARTRDLQEQNRAPVPRLMAQGLLDSVKIQFELHGLIVGRDRDGDYLGARLPDEIYRFQRRANVRVRPLLKHPPFLQLVYPSTPPSATRLRVLDVGLGGVAFAVPAPLPAPTMGDRLDPVDVMLDDDTRFMCSLVVRHTTPGSAPSSTHVGAEFVGLDGMALRLLQRYIFDVQRARRDMAKAGLDDD